MTTSHVTMEHLEDADDGGTGITDAELKSSWTYNRMKKRRSEFTQKGNFRVFCGTWNVNNKVLESSNPPGTLLYLLTYLLTHSLTYLLTHSLTHSLTYLLTYLFTSTKYFITC